MVLKDIRGNDVQLTGPRMPRWGTTNAWHFGDATDVAVSMPGGVRARVGDIVVSQNYYSQGEIYTVSKVYASGNVDLLYNTARFTTRETVYPVGSTWESTSTVNPNDFLPGTWVADPMNAYIPVLAGTTQQFYSWYINNIGMAAATGWRLDSRSGRTDLTYSAPTWGSHAANGGFTFHVPGTYFIEANFYYSGNTGTRVMGFSKSSVSGPDNFQPYARESAQVDAVAKCSSHVDIQAGDTIYFWFYASTSLSLIASAAQGYSRRAVTRIEPIPTVYKWKRTA